MAARDGVIIILFLLFLELLTWDDDPLLWDLVLADANPEPEFWEEVEVGGIMELITDSGPDEAGSSYVNNPNF